jgi:hypothetical protein
MFVTYLVYCLGSFKDDVSSSDYIQGDQKVSVHRMVTVQKTRKNILKSFLNDDAVRRRLNGVMSLQREICVDIFVINSDLKLNFSLPPRSPAQPFVRLP